MTTEILIPKNEVINHNIDMILGRDFWNLLIRESIGGNAGTNHAGVNAYYNTLGELTEFSNYPQPKKSGKKKVIFRVDMGYMLDTRKFYEKLYKKKIETWTIDEIFFEDKQENEVIKSAIEDAANYVNTLSRKQRKERR